MNDSNEERAGFLALLEPAEAGENRWRARAGWLGGEEIPLGLLAAQAMVVAGRSTDTRWRWVRSARVHALAPADPDHEVEYRVEPLLDNDFLSIRLVMGTQDDVPVTTATVSFQTPRRGLGPDRQGAWRGEPPLPLSLPPGISEPDAGIPVDVRYVDHAPWETPPGGDNRLWVRFTEEFPDRILSHAAALAFAADLLLVPPLSAQDGPEWTDLGAATLELSAVFHRGFRADDWLLHECRSSVAEHRAHTTGSVFSSQGRLVATVSQQTALLPLTGPVARASAGARSGAGR